MTEPTTEPMLTRLRLDAPVEVVWRALTDPTELRTWFAEHAEVDLPNRYEFWGRYTPAGDVARQRLLRADGELLRFAWTVQEIETIVAIGLEPDGPHRTMLTLTQTGLPGYVETVQQHGPLSMIYTFWALSLINLADYLEGREPLGRCDLTSTELRAEVPINASRRDVFDALVNPEKFAEWFGASCELEPRVGGRWAMGGFDIDDNPAEIVDLRRDTNFALRWPDGELHTWELAESGGKTTLTFVQSGFSGTATPYGPWMGWLAGFAELRRYLELPNWRQLWVQVRMDGLPEDLLTLN